MCGYHEYSGGVQYTGGYHEYTGGTMTSVGDIMGTHRGIFSALGFPYKFNCFPNDICHDIPLVYS